MRSIPSFNVLERTQEIQRSYMLEASAGTGKTYSIENIVVRLLIDKTSPCTLDNILVVTFTKASTSDLKERIRKNLHKTLQLVREQSLDSPPDYLIALLENGEEARCYAEQQLEQALACFEQAPIFTIHGFCHRMLKEYPLESNFAPSLGDSEEGIAPSLLKGLIKDFFRLELSEQLISKEQLQRAITHTGSFESLEKALYDLVTRGIPIAPVANIKMLFQQFCECMERLKLHISCIAEHILEDFERQAVLYKGICNPQKKPKRENIAKIERFAAILEKKLWELADFDQLISDGLYLVEAIDSTNLVKKKEPLPPEQLHYPHLVEWLKEFIAPIVDRARNPHFIICILAHRCANLVKEYLVRKELFGFDALLSGMYEAVQAPILTEKIRDRFSTAIIDEFQDTDPIQWEIFQKIFIGNGNNSNRLYLVGDPKQSIYGFRQADIYTYLAAEKALEGQTKASLSTNYRSTTPLIEALNALFCSSTAPGMMALPRTGQVLPYMPVKSGGGIAALNLDDKRGALHFFAYEAREEGKKSGDAEHYFFTFIANELVKLQNQGINLSECAVLVSDRYQAARLIDVLQTAKIPAAAQHADSITKTIAFPAMAEMLQGILSPQNESLLKTALGGPILCWSEKAILSLDDPQLLEALIAKCIGLRKIWFQKGFSAFFQALMCSCWSQCETTLAEDLLLRDDGFEMHNNIQQIAELLIEKETTETLPPHQLFRQLNKLLLAEGEGDSIIKKRRNPEREGVRILSIHSSKGLEYQIVFALGVITRTKKPSHFIPIIGENGLPVLTVVDESNDPRYVQYALELDAEKVRQLYVAFTRAKQRLYVPISFPQYGKGCDLGTASPMDIYLAIMGQPEIPFTRIYERIQEIESESTIAFINSLATSQAISISTSAEVVTISTLPTTDAPLVLANIAEALIPGTPRFIHSFTALAATMKDYKNLEAESTSLYFEDQLSPPNDFEYGNKSRHTLPAGSSTGTLLHTLLEMLPFEIAKHNSESRELHSFVEKFTLNTPFEKWKDVLVEILFNTMNMELSTEADDFSLKEINPKHCYREHEFIYSAPSEIHQELKNKPGYLKGVIDLIFMHKEKYYIIDWKSNWLGPSDDFYTPESIQKAMLTHDYFLQATIYKEALKRYLALIDDTPFENLFGGVFYLFLRAAPSSLLPAIK